MIDKLILGTVQLGLPYGINNKEGQPSPLIAHSILAKAFKYGIRYLDTAEAYGNSQHLIGEYHRQAGEANCFRVITKYSAKEKQVNSSEIYQLFLDNLKELGISQLESYLFHSFDSYRNFQSWPVLEKLALENKLKSVGVSVYTNEQANAVAEDGRIKIVQLPFNMLDNINQREAVITKLKKEGKEVHVRSVFLQGLFFKDRNMLAGLTPLKESLEALDRIAAENNLSMATLALAYNLRQPLVDKVLIGVETESQLDQNITSAKESAGVDKQVFEEINNIRVSASELLNPVNWR